MQVAGSALEGLPGLILHLGSPHGGGTGFPGVPPLCTDPAGLGDSVRSPAEIAHSWRKWQGGKELLEDPFIFAYIQVKINKPLRCYDGMQLTNWKTSSILQGDRRLPMLDICGKIIPFFS